MNDGREFFSICDSCGIIQDHSVARLRGEGWSYRHARQNKHSVRMYSKDLVLHLQVDRTGARDNLTLF